MLCVLSSCLTTLPSVGDYESACTDVFSLIGVSNCQNSKDLICEGEKYISGVWALAPQVCKVRYVSPQVQFSHRKCFKAGCALGQEWYYSPEKVMDELSVKGTFELNRYPRNGGGSVGTGEKTATLSKGVKWNLLQFSILGYLQPLVGVNFDAIIHKCPETLPMPSMSTLYCPAVTGITYADKGTKVRLISAQSRILQPLGPAFGLDWICKKVSTYGVLEPVVDYLVHTSEFTAPPCTIFYVVPDGVNSDRYIIRPYEAVEAGINVCIKKDEWLTTEPATGTSNSCKSISLGSLALSQVDGQYIVPMSYQIRILEHPNHEADNPYEVVLMNQDSGGVKCLRHGYDR